MFRFPFLIWHFTFHMCLASFLMALALHISHVAAHISMYHVLFVLPHLAFHVCQLSCHFSSPSTCWILVRNHCGTLVWPLVGTIFELVTHLLDTCRTVLFAQLLYTLCRSLVHLFDTLFTLCILCIYICCKLVLDSL